MSDLAIRAEQIRALYKQGSPLLIANVTNAFLVAAVLWTPGARLGLVAWVAAMTVVIALRLTLRRRFLAVAPHLGAEAITAWGRRFVVGAGAAGLLWGIGAVAFFNPSSAVSQMLLTFVIAGNTAGAAGTQSCYMPSFLAYFLAALIPFAARTLAVGDALHFGMAALIAIYGVVLVMVARSTHTAIRETFQLRFENDGLLGNLSKATIELERSNTILEERVKERTSEVERQATALRAARQMESVGRLAAGVAHDFNNLLTVVLANTNELIARPLGHEESRLLLEDVATASTRGSDLVRQLLAFAGRQTLQPRTFDLSELVRQEGRLLGRLIGAHIDVAFSFAEEPLPVRADPTQLHQVLINLVTNARDAMADGGRLTVRTEARAMAGETTLPAGRYAVLAVRDSGGGMDAETASRVFEPFFTTKGTGRGTGLGLATVHGIAHQSGGSVEVESTPGRGTELRVLLPLRPALEGGGEVRGAARERALGPAGGGEVRRRTVLVAEDEPEVRAVIARIIGGIGHDVLLAADGPSALAAARAHEGAIALLLTDVVMPGFGGPDLFQQLKAERPALRALFVSGYSADQPVPTGEGSRDTAFLAKPFTPDALAAKIAALLATAD